MIVRLQPHNAKWDRLLIKAWSLMFFVDSRRWKGARAAMPFRDFRPLVLDGNQTRVRPDWR